MGRIAVGIDPGIKGAIAAIDAENMKLLEVVDCPVSKNAGRPIYDISSMADVLRRFLKIGTLIGKSAGERSLLPNENEFIVVLEQSQSMPGAEGKNMYSVGRGFGIWEGILAALDIPYRTVRPVVWSRQVFAGTPEEGESGKFRAIRFVLRAFPDIELQPQRCRTPKDGRADAVCIAYWGAMGCWMC